MPLKVLYADDDDHIREIAKISMEQGGLLKVSEFSSGVKAVENLEKVAPDIIVLDVMMPGMTGPEALVEMRLRPGFKNIPVVFLTSMSDEKTLEYLYSLDPAGVLFKPFDANDLARQILSLHNAYKVVSKYVP